MKKITASFALLFLLTTGTGLSRAQTRPRRVGPASGALRAAGSIRPRTTNNAQAADRDMVQSETATEGRGRRWPRMLLETGLMVGGAIGSRSCTPSRHIIGSGPGIYVRPIAW
jgi:hypothetical protein